MNERPRGKSKGPNFRVYVATSFPHANFCEIEELAREHGLGNAQIVRELFFRGLAAYHNDGKLYVEEILNSEAQTAGEFLADNPRNAAAIASGLSSATSSKRALNFST
jgi:hypothetical protein